ncbi:HIT-like domain-containing protein [Thelonectria olida]|uniref:Aprataxin-like protein n=1 Tax=Thelonectria olida TaxID=1576542 RepID=A0A9P9ARF0_9HYPO|nr:HIT-like domain-containing protein [Thelonectria olida]
MAHQDSDPEEAMTQDEIHSQDPPPPPKPSSSTVRNAFTELMTRKPKPTPPPQPPQISRGGNPFKDRMGLGAYLDDPASFPASRVVAHNDAFVCINDRFPKASIHTLLLPRDPAFNLQHPFDAFEDAEFLASVRAEADKLKVLVAKELQRRFGVFSKRDAALQAVLNGDAEPSADGQLPKGRDWSAEVVCGVHAVPSMRHLHVHVLSRDMHSETVRHRKHYNSFNTPFLVNLDDFPLPDGDPRRHTKEAGYLRYDLKCWRCGRNFGNQFQKLKSHLDEEFDKWKKE